MDKISAVSGESEIKNLREKATIEKKTKIRGNSVTATLTRQKKFVGAGKIVRSEIKKSRIETEMRIDSAIVTKNK